MFSGSWKQSMVGEGPLGNRVPVRDMIWVFPEGPNCQTGLDGFLCD